MIRVLFATRAFESAEIEGGYLLLKDIAREMASGDDLAPHFLALNDGDADGITLHRAYSRTGWGAWQRLQMFLALLRNLRNVDVVHLAHTPTRLNGLMLRFLKWRHPYVRFVQTVTGFTRLTRRSPWLFWGDVVTAVSPRVAKFLQDEHNIAAVSMAPHPRTQRMESAAAVPNKVDARFRDQRLIVFPIDVFRLNLEAFDIAAVCQGVLSQCEDAHFVVLDRFNEEALVRDCLTELPADRLTCLPVIDYMPSLLARAETIAFPMSDTDGKFNPPMVLYEARYFGKPVVCPDGIDMQGDSITRLPGNSTANDWVSAILATLNKPAAKLPDDHSFAENYRQWLPTYRAAETASVQPFAELVENLGDWAAKQSIPVFHRDNDLITADLSGQKDVDIWVRAADAATVNNYLGRLPGCRAIHRSDQYWTSHDVYLIDVEGGTIQLDVGVGRISSGALSYARLDEFDAGGGLVPLPADVEIFSRGAKSLLRGATALDQDFMQQALAELDEPAQARLGRFLGQPVETMDAERLEDALAERVRSARWAALSRPFQWLRITAVKMTLPGWPAPFARRTRGQVVAVTGTDGAGKSTTVEALAAGLQDNGYRTRYVYMGRGRGNRLVPESLKRRAESDYREKPSDWKKVAASWVYLVDFLARFAHLWLLTRVRGITVLCDRYHIDIQLMERYSTVAYGLLDTLSLKPDVFAVLDCPTETLMARKGERTEEEYERQRAFYLDTARRIRVRSWRGSFNSESDTAETIASAIRYRVLRASHRNFDY